MLNSNVFYHKTIRNTIVAFGRLFSNIKFERKNEEGETEQIINVPIAYSQKEKWMHSVEMNPNETRGVYTTLPRIGFEILGYSYDSSRKLQRMNRMMKDVDNQKRNHLFTPVPYNIDISLYFATKTQEDSLQILEQILPAFTPEYTISINAIPDFDIVQDVPIILQSVTVQDDYEGDMETRRFVIHTLSFQAKINLYGGVSDIGVITQVEATTDNPATKYTATQLSPDDELTESWEDNF